MEQAGDVLRGVGRAGGGALLFALPIFLTMEVWRLAVVIPGWRLALLVVLTIALAVVLSYFLGFESTPNWTGAVLDSMVALLVGFATAALLLWVMSVIGPGVGWREATSIITLAALPATIGASFARAQLGENQQSGASDPSYAHELFLMGAGAVVLAANVAPTEEVVLVAAMMNEVKVLILVGLELLLMHAFVYGVGFKGGSSADSFWTAFGHFTVVGYAIVLMLCAYLLWTFGRFDGTGLLPAVMQTVVLALPASLGAAAARLIL